MWFPEKQSPLCCNRRSCDAARPKRLSGLRAPASERSPRRSGLDGGFGHGSPPVCCWAIQPPSRTCPRCRAERAAVRGLQHRKRLRRRGALQFLFNMALVRAARLFRGRNDLCSAQFSHLKSNKRIRAGRVALGGSPPPPLPPRRPSSGVIIPRCVRMPIVALPRDCAAVGALKG